MSAFRLTGSLSEEIELKLRDRGSVIVSESWNCWLQFFYQQLDSHTTNVGVKEVPVFTAVGVDDKELIISECPDTVRVNDSLNVPMNAIDITEIDSRVFEQMNMFNSMTKKTVKRIKLNFKLFHFEQFKLLLNQHILIVHGPENRERLEHIVPFSRIKNLGLNAGFVRPKWDTLSEAARVAFWVYQLGKQTERVFPPENVPRDVEFKDCVSAKDYLLV